MTPETVNFEGKTLTLQDGKSHSYGQVILLNSGIIGRRERSIYPDWFKGFYYLKIGNNVHRFHVDEIAGVYQDALVS